MQKKTLAQQVADTIYEMIVKEKAFLPGHQLSGENDLSESLGVSRATLREAIRILCSQGILEVYRGKGTFVAENLKVYGEVGLEDLSRTRARLKDLFEARLLFEPEMAALACRRATDVEMKEILRLGKETEYTIMQGEDRTTADRAFHQAIVTATHNDFMLRLLPIITRSIEDVIRLNVEYASLSKSTLQDHSLLMGFLENRDADGSRQAMSIHLHHAINTLHLNIDDDPIY